MRAKKNNSKSKYKSKIFKVIIKANYIYFLYMTNLK